MPSGGDIGTTVIADRAQHSRHQFVERGLVRKVLDIEDRAVAAIRVAAIDPHPLVPEAALVRERHRLVVEHEVFDRPRHTPIPPIGREVKIAAQRELEIRLGL